jgi:hypothetical protein
MASHKTANTQLITKYYHAIYWNTFILYSSRFIFLEYENGFRAYYIYISFLTKVRSIGVNIGKRQLRRVF